MSPLNPSQKKIFTIAIVAMVAVVAFRVATASTSSDVTGEIAEGFGAIMAVAVFAAYLNRDRKAQG